MATRRILRKIGRAASVIRTNGVRAFADKAWLKLREVSGFQTAAQKRYFAQKAQIDRRFDAAYNLDTGGIQRLHDLTIESAASRFGTSHIASDPDQFAVAIRSIDTPVDGFTFIDFGSGKGRALILALAFPFARIVGIEFARELHEIARGNVASVARIDRSAARIEPVCADASQYAPPDEPLVLYFFHPFDAPVMQAVAERALASWRAAPRPMRVVYVNPLYLDVWTAAGWSVTLRADFHVVLAPAA